MHTRKQDSSHAEDLNELVSETSADFWLPSWRLSPGDQAPVVTMEGLGVISPLEGRRGQPRTRGEAGATADRLAVLPARLSIAVAPRAIDAPSVQLVTTKYIPALHGGRS